MDSLRVEVDARSPVRCPYCHADVNVAEEWSACATCLARHHRECWNEHRGCGTCGRKSALRPEGVLASTLVPKPSRRLAWVCVALALVVLGLGFVAFDEYRKRAAADLLAEQYRWDVSQASDQLRTAEAGTLRAITAKRELEEKLADVGRLIVARDQATARSITVEPFSTRIGGIPLTTKDLHLDARRQGFERPFGSVVASTQLVVHEEGNFEVVVRSDAPTLVRVDGRLVLQHVTGITSDVVLLDRGRHTLEIEREGGKPVKLDLDVWRAPY